MKKFLLILSSLVLAILMVSPAEAGPRPLVASVSHVSGVEYPDQIGIAWEFSGNAGKYQRLHVDVLCWYNEQDVDSSTGFAYGSSVYLAGYEVETQYPGSGVAYFYPDFAPWTYTAAPVYHCRATLLHWTSKGAGIEHARDYFTFGDSRL